MIPAKEQVKLTLSEILNKYNIEVDEKFALDSGKSTKQTKLTVETVKSESVKSQGGTRITNVKRHSCGFGAADLRKEPKKPKSRASSGAKTPVSRSHPSTANTSDYQSSEDDDSPQDDRVERRELKFEEIQAAEAEVKSTLSKKIETLAEEWKFDTFPKPVNFYAVLFKKTGPGE